MTETNLRDDLLVSLAEMMSEQTKLEQQLKRTNICIDALVDKINSLPNDES